MNMVKLYTRCLALALFPTAFIVNCTGDPGIAGGTTETTSAEITGTIWNEDGTRAKGVLVKLVPADFNPYSSQNAGEMDSTFTDGNGAYGFDLGSSGFFNVSARDGGKYCYEDSVWGSEKYRTTVKDDTLRTPGSIRGVARLRSGDDNRKIVVLVLGTNTYAMPGDSTGAFVIPVLAEGDYALRLLTTDKDYGAIDTNVTVTTGTTTEIPGILLLSYRGVPSVDPVVARLDPQTMYVTVSWPPCDTSEIAAFYVFRNTGITNKPFAIVNSADTSFTDDVVLLDPDTLTFGDTLRYSVAAVGKDRRLGKVGVAPDVLLKSFVTPIDTISLADLHLLEMEVLPSVAVDINHCLYFNGNSLLKVDSIGRVAAKYADPTAYVGPVAIDRNGNVYAVLSSSLSLSRPRLTKFSSDLKPVANTVIDNAPEQGNVAITTNENGLVYLFMNDGRETTLVEVFDSSLSIVRSDTIPEFCFQPAMHDDTFYINLNDWGGGAQPNTVKLYDNRGDLLQSRDLTAMIDAYYPSSFGSRGYLDRFFFTVDHTLLLICSSSFLIAVGADGAPRGRCFLKGCWWYAFDGIDRLYVTDELLQTVYVYKIN